MKKNTNITYLLYNITIIKILILFRKIDVMIIPSIYPFLILKYTYTTPTIKN